MTRSCWTSSARCPRTRSPPRRRCRKPRAALDRIVAGRVAGDEENAKRRLIAAEVAVTQAQLVIIAAALHATTTVFDALGASGVSEQRGLDRHWRNARTLASHNPRVYKARILGDWLINGKDPVSNLAALGRGGQGN